MTSKAFRTRFGRELRTCVYTVENIEISRKENATGGDFFLFILRAEFSVYYERDR